jgi:hypothetical protein
MDQNLSAIQLTSDPSHVVRCGLAARTAENKAVDALVETKTTDDKAAAVPLAIALLVVKAADDS